MRILVDPVDGLVDQLLAIRIVGAPPGGDLTLVAATIDADGAAWRSRSHFRADLAGIIDTARDAPVAGAYRGIDPDGSIWSMTPAAGAASFALHPAALRVLISIEGAIDVEPVMVVRRWLLPGVLRSTGLAGTIVTPPYGELLPAIVLASRQIDVTGLEPVAALLAAHGYLAAIVPSRADGELARAMLDVATHPAVDAGRIGLLWLGSDQPERGERAITAIAIDPAAHPAGDALLAGMLPLVPTAGPDRDVIAATSRARWFAILRAFGNQL